MNPLRPFQATAVTLGFLVLVNAFAVPNPNNAAVDKLFARWDRKDSPGAAIVVVKDGAVVYLHGYGYANLEHGIPKIADIYLGLTDPDKKAAKSRPTVQAEPVTWDAFLGTYRLGAGWLLTITREGDTLMTQATHEDKFNMTPCGTNTFLVEAYHNQEVEFVRQPSGAVTNLLFHGINAPKLNLRKMTPAHLEDYVGDYWSEELRVAKRMEIHDGKLATRQRSGDWLHFLPTGADRFDADFDGWALQFTRDAASHVTETKISGGRVRNIRFTRTRLPLSEFSTP